LRTAQAELSAGLDFLINSKTSALLEVTIPEQEKVYPMIASGARYDQMVDFKTKSDKGSEMLVHLNRVEKR
jgi:thiamine pyrophosphate-dependent acetolactate synthase large subunit-like protein